jgi:hypothetical protein
VATVVIPAKLGIGGGVPVEIRKILSWINVESDNKAVNARVPVAMGIMSFTHQGGDVPLFFKKEMVLLVLVTEEAIMDMDGDEIMANNGEQGTKGWLVMMHNVGCECLAWKGIE